MTVKQLVGLLIFSFIFVPVWPADAVSLVDCFKWNPVRVEPLEVIVDIDASVHTLQARDLYFGAYLHPESGVSCTRFFFKNGGLVLAQSWRGEDGKPYAYLLLEGAVPYFAENAHIRWRLERYLNKGDASNFQIELGVFENGVRTRTVLLDSIPARANPFLDN